jgi:tetratricopeptide (TPR) repeat protein
MDYAAVREAFAEAHQISGEARRRFLATLPSAEGAEVESLLAALEGEAGAPFADEGLAEAGPYSLKEVLGRGGMGIVYRAERQDGEFRREVAVKLAGGRMFAPEAERRFIRERQILAQLDHPNIVRMLDGGVVRGQRYVVMELVRGVPITSYARELPLRRRLILFRQVCAAVQHAHQKLILHRDLKPGNILVTEDGFVKVLDFGIAQLIQDDAGAITSTETSAHPFSLACASPEQLLGDPLTLASDIYSLGVLLYELTTGINPQYREGDSFQQVLTRITDNGPKAPSKLQSDVRRDLDAIVWKALAKDPNQRYSSAGELDADIERYLADRPVSVVAPSRPYVLVQFARRNRALTVLAILSLVASVVGGTLYVRQARREARRFAEARRLVRTVVFDIQPKLKTIPATLPLRKTLVDETLRYLEAVSADAGNDTGLLREIAKAYAELGAMQAGGEGPILGNAGSAESAFTKAREVIGRAIKAAPSNYDILIDAANVHSRSASALYSVGKVGEAQAASSQAVEFANHALGLRPRERISRETYALSVYTRGLIALPRDQSLSRASFVEAERVYSDLARDVPEQLTNVGLSELYLTRLAHQAGDKAEWINHARRTLAIFEQQLKATPENQRSLSNYGMALEQLGSAINSTDGPHAALPYLQKSLALREEMASQDPANLSARSGLADSLRFLGAIYSSAGDFRQARTALARSIGIYDSLLREGKLQPGTSINPPQTLLIAGEIERKAGDHLRACFFYRRAEEMYARVEKAGILTASGEKDRALGLSHLSECR